MNAIVDSNTEVAERLHLCLPQFPLEKDTPIAALGLDSMDTVELLCVVHEEFGIRLTEDDLHPAQTTHGLVRVIARKLNH